MNLQIAPMQKLRFEDNNGNPLVGGKLFTYAAGTTTKLNTFTDASGGTPNANPVILDSRGECNCWLTPGLAYKFTLSPSTDTDPPTNAFWTVDNIQGVPTQVLPLRGQIGGLTMSAQGTSTFSVTSGQACDFTGATLMTLGVGLTKTTSIWVSGNNQGGLDTGVIATNTWYHVYLIFNPNTQAADITFSLNAALPALPSGYTFYRRIGSVKTDGSLHFIPFIQDGDLFQWQLPVTLDINVSNPGTSAVLRTITTPFGVNTVAILAITLANVDATKMSAYFSDPGTTDVAPLSGAFAQVGAAVSGAIYQSGEVQVRTNTASQVRTRVDYSSVNVILQAGTLGWIDTRGRFA